MNAMPSLQEVDERLRALGEKPVLTPEDERAIAQLAALSFPAASQAASRPASARRLRLAQFVDRPAGRVAMVFLAAALLLTASGIVVVASTQHEASRPTQPISRQQAIVNAMSHLANHGAGFTVVAARLAPSSSHVDYTAPNGQGFGIDGAQECLVIPPLPPLPFLTPCRDFPVWLVALSSPNCDVIIAVNAHTGRFAGGGASNQGPGLSTSGALDGCPIDPGAGEAAPVWLQPVWE